MNHPKPRLKEENVNVGIRRVIKPAVDLAVESAYGTQGALPLRGEANNIK